MEQLKKGDRVRFIDETEEESKFTMTVLEVNDDRILVETEVPGLVYHPTSVCPAESLVKVTDGDGVK